MWPFKKKISLTDDELRVMQMEEYNSHVHNDVDDFWFSDVMIYPYGISDKGKEVIPYNGITMVKWTKRKIPSLEDFKAYEAILTSFAYEFNRAPAQVHVYLGDNVPRTFTFATNDEAERVFGRINDKLSSWLESTKI